MYARASGVICPAPRYPVPTTARDPRAPGAFTGVSATCYWWGPKNSMTTAPWGNVVTKVLPDRLGIATPERRLPLFAQAGRLHGALRILLPGLLQLGMLRQRNDEVGGSLRGTALATSGTPALGAHGCLQGGGRKGANLRPRPQPVKRLRASNRRSPSGRPGIVARRHPRPLGPARRSCAPASRAPGRGGPVLVAGDGESRAVQPPPSTGTRPKGRRREGRPPLAAPDRPPEAVPVLRGGSASPGRLPHAAGSAP